MVDFTPSWADVTVKVSGGPRRETPGRVVDVFTEPPVGLSTSPARARAKTPSQALSEARDESDPGTGERARLGLADLPADVFAR